MKNIFWISLVVAILALGVFSPVLASGFNQTETPPIVLAEFPVLESLLFAGISWVVTQGFKALSRLTSKPLEGTATAITGALVFIAVELVNVFFGLIPPEYQEVTRNVLVLFVGILSMYGIAGTVKSFQPAKHK